MVGGSEVQEESLEVSEGLHLAYLPPPSTSEQVGEAICVAGDRMTCYIVCRMVWSWALMIVSRI